MNDKKENLRLSSETVLMIIGRVMKRDALLHPYFEDGSIEITDNQEEDYISFREGVSGETRKFVLDRVRTIRGLKPEEWDEEKYANWEEREKMIRAAEEKEELAWYFKERYIGITNDAETCKVWIDTDLPAEEIRWLNKKILEIWIGEEMDDDVAEKLTKALVEEHTGKDQSRPETKAAIRDLAIEALREDEMIAEYIEKGLIKFNTDPTKKIWEIDNSLTPEEIGFIHNLGIFVMINRFGIDPDKYFKTDNQD